MKGSPEKVGRCSQLTGDLAVARFVIKWVGCSVSTIGTNSVANAFSGMVDVVVGVRSKCI